MTRITTIAAALLTTALLAGTGGVGSAEEPVDYPRFNGGALTAFTMKVENNGTVSSLFDALELRAGAELSPHTRVCARLDGADFLGYNAGWTDGPDGTIGEEAGFSRTLAYIESEILGQSGMDTPVFLELYLGYGGHQQVLVQDVTRYRFERSGTSGIDGFDIAATLGFTDRFALTGAMNPASFDENSKSGSGASARPDIFAAFFMKNDHRGVSWGKHIHFTESTMQLFFDNSANPANNRLYDDLTTGDALTLGIGGTLSLTFAGIDIFGFGLTEYFLMDDRNLDDILQAQWCAGFAVPLLAGMQANLSGSNAMVLSDDGEGSFINFGLDVRLMLTPVFGIFGAGAVVGLLDDTGGSAEGGFCLDFDHFEIYAGYSDHAIDTEDKYAKGAFDKTELRDGRALDGGFFLTVEAGF